MASASCVLCCLKRAPESERSRSGSWLQRSPQQIRLLGCFSGSPLKTTAHHPSLEDGGAPLIRLHAALPTERAGDELGVQQERGVRREVAESERKRGRSIAHGSRQPKTPMPPGRSGFCR